MCRLGRFDFSRKYISHCYKELTIMPDHEVFFFLLSSEDVLLCAVCAYVCVVRSFLFLFLPTTTRKGSLV